AVTCVANRTFRGVARATLAAVRPLLEEETKEQSGVASWQPALQVAMIHLATSDKRGIEAVRVVLEHMELAAGELHGPFAKQLPAHMREAARVLGTFERSGSNGYQITLREKPGRGWYRPWGAARKFAKAF